MADNPIQGNEGASRQRLEELKQINLEGAKAKSTLEGLSSVFKNLGRSASSLSAQQQEFAKKAIESSNLLAGQVDNFNKSYKKNIDLAKSLQGFTVSQLKNAAERRKFEKQTLAAQNEQAQIQASIAELTEQKLELEAQFETISDKAAIAAQKEKEAIEAAAAARQKQLDISKLVEAENKVASDSAFESSKRIQDYGKEIEASQTRRNKLAQDKAALATKEGKAAFEEAQGRKFTEAEIQKVIAAKQQSLNEEYNLQKALQKKIAAESENVELQRSLQKEGEKTLENLENQVIQAEKNVDKAKEIHKALGEQTEELQAQIETTDLIKKNHEQAAVEIEKGLENAGKLQKKIEAVDKAGGKLLEGFQNLGNALLSNVPIIGQAFDAIFGQLGKARQMFQDATAQGTSKLGAMFKATQGFITSLTVVGIGAFMSSLFSGMKTASEFGKVVRQGLGGGMIDASKSMAAASAAAGRLTIPLAEAGAMVGELNDALGTSLGFNADQLTTFGTLTKKIGVSADAAAHLFEQSVKLGIPYKELTANIVGATEKLNAMNGTAIAPKAVLEEMGHASQTILRNMKQNPDALIKAAAGARALGMSMNDIANAAESTLDFESSMQKEMEAELMLGKELNLDRLRAAAASGDVNAQQAEMKRLVLENKDALKGNVLAQQMFADTIGLSKEELNKMMNEEEKQRKLGKQDAARQAANDRMKKMSQKEIGYQTMKSMESIASLADRIDKFIESFQQGVVKFAKKFMQSIKPLTNVVADIFNADTMEEKWKVIKAKLWPAIKESFKNLSGLVMESLGEGFGGIADIFKDKDKDLLSNGGILGKLLGGLVVGGAGLSIAFKGLSALGGMFSKLRGTRFMPMYTKSVDGVGSNNRIGSNIFKHLFRKGGGNIFGRISRVFNRGLLRMFGKNPLSRAMAGPKGIISRLNNIKMPNLTRIFSRLKMPNLTNIFSKIKLPKLPNLTNLFSKIKLPKLPNLTNLFSKIKLPNLTNVFSKIKIPSGAASGLLKTVGGKILAPLELAMGAFKGVNQVKDLTAEQKKEQGIREDMGTTEAGILGALTGNANKGSSLSKYVGIEEGSAGDEALGIAASGARGAMVGAAIGSVIPVVGTAVGAYVGGAVGVISEGFKVFSDPNSKLRQGITEFATNTWDKAKEIGSKVKEKAMEVGVAIKDFAVGVKDKAVEVGGRIKDFAIGVKDKALEVGGQIKDFAVGVKDRAVEFATGVKSKISAFASSVGEGIKSFANTARDKAKAFAGAVGEKIGNIRGKIADFIDANDGLVGGIRAAAAGLASKASKWFGSKVQGLKDWWNGTSAATPEIKEAEIKKVTSPLVQMSTSQSKELMAALNTAMNKGAEATVKAVNQFGDNIEPYITEARITAEDQLKKMKELKEQSDKQHQNEITELRNQTALLYQYITNPQKSIIKMDSYKVGESLVSRY